MGQEREIFIELIENFKRAEYLLYCELDNIDDNVNYIVSVYSFEDINIEEIDNNSYKYILEKIYISCAKKKKSNLSSGSNDDSPNEKSNEVNNNRNSSFKKIKVKNAPKIVKYSESTLEGYSYIYIENLEQDITLIENANYHNFEGYKLLPPYSGSSFYVEVKPGECKIILIKHLELIETNNIEVFDRSNLLYGSETLFELTKKRGRKKKRIDKKTGKKTNINVYIFKHDFGICFLYRNKTNDMILKEKVNIENNTNIEFSNEYKTNNNKEITICVEPNKDYFLNLKSKHFLWKVNPVFSYTIETIPNMEKDEVQKNESNSPKGLINYIINKRKINRVRSYSPSSIKSDLKENKNIKEDIFENDIDNNDNENDNNDNDKEDSAENDGDSSDINISDDNSEESI
jgi:hypothetical protein